MSMCLIHLSSPDLFSSHPPWINYLATLAPRALPYDALPLRFTLLRPLSGSSSPCPCLSVSLPFQSTSTPSISSTSTGHTEDLTRGGQRPSIEVFRSLDPEPREPYISLGRIFLACGLTPIEGLLRFKLERPDYDSTLGGIAPFYDIWVSLRDAREIAKELGVSNQLSGLLEWETRKAYSVEDKEEGGITHNWKIASDRIPPQDYSTQQMLSVPFPRIHLLPSGSQVRTLLPPISTFESYNSSPTISVPSSVVPSVNNYDALWIKLMEWSINEYENWLELDSQEENSTDSTSSSPTSSSPSSGSGQINAHVDEPSLTPLFLFSTLFPLLSLTDQLPSTSTSNLNQLSHLQDVVLSRSELLPTSSVSVSTPTERRLRSSMKKSLRKGNLYLVDAVTRIVLDAYRRTSNGDAAEEETKVKSREGVGTGGKDNRRRRNQKEEKEEEEWKKVFEKRILALEVEREDMLSRGRPGETDPLSLRNEMEELRQRIRKLEAGENGVKEATVSSVGSHLSSLYGGSGVASDQEVVSTGEAANSKIENRQSLYKPLERRMGDWFITFGVQVVLVLVVAEFYVRYLRA
ncbi:hypothetical protein JCM5350_005254 [Sporobolomyces pararoseus]